MPLPDEKRSILDRNRSFRVNPAAASQQEEARRTTLRTASTPRPTQRRSSRAQRPSPPKPPSGVNVSSMSVVNTPNRGGPFPGLAANIDMRMRQNPTVLGRGLGIIQETIGNPIILNQIQSARGFLSGERPTWQPVWGSRAAGPRIPGQWFTNPANALNYIPRAFFDMSEEIIFGGLTGGEEG